MKYERGLDQSGLSNNGEQFRRTRKPNHDSSRYGAGFEQALEPARQRTFSLRLQMSSMTRRRRGRSGGDPGCRRSCRLGDTVRQAGTIRMSKRRRLKQAWKARIRCVQRRLFRLYLDNYLLKWHWEKIEAKATRYPNGGQVAAARCQRKGNEIAFFLSRTSFPTRQPLAVCRPAPRRHTNDTVYEAA
jgi:hypothetical protein